MTQVPPISDLVGVQLVAGVDTPPDQVQYNGAVVFVSAATLNNTGSGAGNPGYLGPLRGYLQAGGPVGKQWVMTALITQAMTTAFNAIPPHGWLDATAEQQYVDMGTALLNPPYNAPGPDVINLLSVLYHAALANEAAAP